MAGGFEQNRYKGMLESLQQTDFDIDHIVMYSKFVVAYLLQQDGPNPGWRKANIEGPVYLVRRRTTPKYQLLVKNQFSTNDLLDSLHPEWELDLQKNYIFYKVEDPSKRIRGLWFHDDTERQKLEGALQKTLDELRKPSEPEPKRSTGDAQVDALYAQFGFTKPEGGLTAETGAGQAGAGQAAGRPGNASNRERAPAPQNQTGVTRESLRAALHALADDEFFVGHVLQKLKDSVSDEML